MNSHFNSQIKIQDRFKLNSKILEYLISEKNLENKVSIEIGETLHHKRDKDHQKREIEFNLLSEALLLKEDQINYHQKHQDKNIWINLLKAVREQP